MAGHRRGRWPRPAHQIRNRLLHRRHPCWLLLTPARRYFLKPWFWAGIALALLIFLPNFFWLVHHDFISYHFLQHIHIRDVGEGRADGFLQHQFLVCANLFAAPLWLLGLVGFLLNRRYRMLAFMYLVPLALFFFGKGRGYYMAGALPSAHRHGRGHARALASVDAALGTPRNVDRLLFGAGTRRRLRHRARRSRCQPADRCATSRSSTTATCAKRSAGTIWSRTVAQIRDSLPPDQQAHLGITTGNYGEYGAIEILGAAYGLPQPIGTTNSE